MARLSKIWALCLVASVLLSTSACNASNLEESRLVTVGCDFRKAHWGDTIEEVRKNATEELDGIDDLSGEVHICGYKAEIEYGFINGKLHGGVYIVDISNIGKDKYKNTYDTFAQHLTEEQGKPILVLENMAVWENTTTLTSLLLQEDEPSISILYTMNRHDFHNSNWGDTQSKVVDNEQDVSFNPFGSEDLLVGKVITDDYELRIAYEFSDNKLIQGLDTFYLESSDSKAYLELYSELKNHLIDRYGEACKDSTTNVKSQEEITSIDEEELSSLLDRGLILFYTIFETDESDIMLNMRLQKGEISLSVFYTSNLSYYAGKNGDAHPN